MTNIWKRILSVILTFVMVFGMIPNNRAVAITNITNPVIQTETDLIDIAEVNTAENDQKLTEEAEGKLSATDGATETTNVAKIGDTEYATLKAAMTEANKAAGDYTITLLNDSAEVFTFAQKSGVNITIDGDGHTFSGKITLNAGGGNLTFTDAKIAPANSQTIYLNASTAPNVIFDGCILQGANKSGTIVYGYASATSNSITVQNCTADNLQYIVSHRQTGSSSVLVENVTATNMIYLARTLKCPSVTIKDVTCDAVIGIEIRNDIGSQGGKLTLENVNINVVTYRDTVFYPVEGSSGTNESPNWTVELKGVNQFSANGIAYEDMTWFSGNTGCVTDIEAQNGSKFGSLADIAKDAKPGDTIKLLKNYNGEAVTLPTGVKLDANEMDGADKITVVIPNYLVQIGDRGYESLQAAIDAADAGDTITFLADITEDVTVSKDVTIDGGNFKYTGTMKTTENVTLTIQNVNFVKGSIDADTSAQGRKLTIKGCTFDGVDASIGYAITVRHGAYIVIENSSAKNYSTGMLYVPQHVVAITIKNVAVENVAAAFNISYSGDATFEEVSFKNVSYGIHFQIWADGSRTYTVKNCDLSGATNPFWFWDKSNQTAKVTVVFEGDNIVPKFQTISYTTSGVLKLAKGATLTAPEGLTVVTDVANHEVVYENGVYSVAEKKVYVAQVGEQGYESLQAAINAANAGNTITFLADITEDVTISKNLTIDGNGFKYTGTMTISGDPSVTIQNVAFVKGYIVQNGEKTTATLTVKGCSFINGGYAITTERILNLIVDNCTVSNQSLIYAKLTTSHVVVTNVTINNGNYLAHLVYGTDAYFENVTATNMPYYGICTQNYGAKTITLKNCSFDAQWPLAVRNDRTSASDTFVFESTNVMSNLENADNCIYKLAEGATLTAPEGLTITTDVADYQVVYENGVYKLGKKATQVTVTVGNATMVEGNEYPEFTYTTDVDGLTLDITFTVDGTTINATVAPVEGYEFIVVPGKLTVEKALVRVYADSNAKVKYFTSLEEAMEYAVKQNDYVPIYLLDNVTVTKPIVIADDRNNTMELQGVKLGGNTLTITSTFDGPLFKMESGVLSVKNLIIDAKGDAFQVTGGTLNLNSHSKDSQFLNITSQTGSCVNVNGGTVNVNGANLSAQGTDAAIKGTGSANINIAKWNIGTLLPTVMAPKAEKTIDWSSNGKVSIVCGTFDEDVSELCDTGHGAEPQGDGTYVVKPMVVITIGGATMVQGNALPTDFSFTVNYYGWTGLTATMKEYRFNTDGKTAGEFEITGTPNPIEGYYVKVVPGKLTVLLAVAQIGATKYETLVEALKAAKAEEIVVLLVSHDMKGALAIPAGVTLDLNGMILTVTGAVNSGNGVIDTSTETTGGLKVNGAAKFDLKNNKYMPIYDSKEGCYRFFEYRVVNKETNPNNVSDTVAVFGLAIRFANIKAYELLARGDSTITVRFTLSWTIDGTTTTAVYDFVDPKVMKDWADNAYTRYKINKDQGKNIDDDQVDLVLTLSVKGLDALGENKLDVAPGVVSESTNFIVKTQGFEFDRTKYISSGNSSEGTKPTDGEEGSGENQSGGTDA